jgi:acyl-CoA oxidase
LTGTKWWIGAAGQTATHTVALCKLIMDDKDCGLHWFIVQLRDVNTGRLLPGVTAGDVGAKVARNGLDNGWIQFSNVRIPRENMLMKWAQVSPSGQFTPPENPAISYNTLITERLITVSNNILVVVTESCSFLLWWKC